MSEDRVDVLWRHLHGMWDPDEQAGSQLTVMAGAIIHDPQAHIDALVKAGVLRRAYGTFQQYEVVQPEPPHVHEFTVGWMEDGCVVLHCGCNALRRVPNRLPINAPA